MRSTGAAAGCVLIPAPRDMGPAADWGGRRIAHPASLAGHQPRYNGPVSLRVAFAPVGLQPAGASLRIKPEGASLRILGRSRLHDAGDLIGHRQVTAVA